MAPNNFWCPLRHFCFKSYWRLEFLGGSSISGKFAHPCVTVSFGLFDREDEDTVIFETSVTVYKSERRNTIEGLNLQTVN